MPTIWTGVHRVIEAVCVSNRGQNASIDLIAQVVTNVGLLPDVKCATGASKLALLDRQSGA
jgi:hypothetical protein